MKVKCITNELNFVRLGELVDVVGENHSYYTIDSPFFGVLSYPKVYFESIHEVSLEAQLEASKQETIRLENLLSEQAPKVGDKYIYDGVGTFEDSVLMVSSIRCCGKSLYFLVILECPHSPADVGLTWCDPEEDINLVFGESSKNSFSKISI